MKIIPATPSHAPLIGHCITQAIGPEITSAWAGEHHTTAQVETMFASLAARTDTQYSYLNTLVAIDDEGSPMGVCVAYDGAGLESLRRPFLIAVKNWLDIDLDSMPDECEPGEFYIDTIAVLPAFRRRGVASALLKATVSRATLQGKPAGLLVDRSNAKARALYGKNGFVKVGDRPFAHVEMDHLQHPTFTQHPSTTIPL